MELVSVILIIMFCERVSFMPSIPRIKAYKGKGHYIFVSYSHDNKDTVYPFIAALQKKYNVWFDDGLHYGKEFEDELAEKLEGCSLFVFMVSNESLESDFCMEELFYAREQRKPFVNILTESRIIFSKSLSVKLII